MLIMKRKIRVALMANTPLRSFRIPDEVYVPAKKHAEADGVPLTAVIVSALIEFAEGNNVSG